MNPQLNDTDPATQDVYSEMLAAAPEWKRAEIMFAMIETVRRLVFAGARAISAGRRG